MRTVLSVIGLGLAMGSACRRADPATLTVGAASDLISTFDLLARELRDEGQPISVTYASTGTLAAQLRHGAPLDVFAAADEATVIALAQEGHCAPSTVRHFATGQLVLLARPELGLHTLDDLGKTEVKKLALADPSHAPYGKAAMEALRHRGLWPAVEAKVVLAESVRQAQIFVSQGNADAALVARSLAPDAPAIATSLHAPLRQAIVLCGPPERQALGRRFWQLVLSPRGRAALEERGFALPPAQATPGE